MRKTYFALLFRMVSHIMIFCFVATLTGCKKNPPVFQLISNTNCNPPCWLNIIPGETTKSEAIKILKGNINIDPNSIAVKGEQWNGFNDVVVFKMQPNKISGEIDFLNDKVAFLGLFGDLNINFGEAIKKLGEPSFILNVPTIYGPPGFPQTSYEILAIIPLEGINFAYNTNDVHSKSKSIIAPENKITRIDFYDTHTYDQLLEAGTFSEGFLNKEETIKYMIPWSGYGEIDQKYPPAKNIP